MEKIAGRYEVVKELGEGGFGSVYLARHVDLEHLYAVKILKQDLAEDEQFIERFKREAKIIARLVHKNSIQLRDFGKTEDGLYMAMDYCQGKPLSEVLENNGPLAPGQVIDIAIQILDVLEDAHKLGIVHRDIKPENIMIEKDSDGQDIVKVLDFGIAKLRESLEESAQTLTQSGSIIGTAAYMSPEQASGSDEVDYRSDLYSVGVAMYQMLVGRVPFKGKSASQTLMMHLTQDPPPFAEITDESLDIPGDIETVVRRAMEKERDKRFNTATEFREVLRSMREAGGSYEKVSVIDGTVSMIQTQISSGVHPIFSESQEREKKKSQQKMMIGAGLALFIMVVLISVLYVAFSDKKAPEFTLKNFPDQGLVKGNVFTLRGEVDDPEAVVTSGDIEGRVNGGEFAIDIPLGKEGNQEIALQFTDPFGNVNEKKFLVQVDRTPPKLTIKSPAKAEEITPKAEYIITGSAFDSAGEVSLSINKEKVSLEDGDFEKKVTLSEGKNTFDIKLRDKVGNITSRTVVLTARLSPAMPEVLSPSEGFSTTAEKVEIVCRPNHPAREVFIGGRKATSLGDGRYKAEVPLKVGSNSVLLAAVDQFDRKGTKKFVVVRKLGDDSFEPNGNQFQAKLVEKRRLGGLILKPGDEDWYTVKLDQRVNFEVRLECPDEGTRLNLEIYDDNVKALGRGKKMGKAVVVQREILSKLVYIRVWGDKNQGGEYTLVTVIGKIANLGWHNEKMPSGLVRRTRVLVGEPPFRKPDGALASKAEEAKEYRRKKDGAVMVYINPGWFLMGAIESSKNARNEEKPQIRVYLQGYYIDKYEITNGQYARFTKTTKYKTVAERIGRSRSWAASEWRRYVTKKGLNWMNPWPVAGGLGFQKKHPVVHMAYQDAEAYAQWAGAALPTEAQWEKAARGTDGRWHPWGKGEVHADGVYRANYVTGSDWQRRGRDGALTTAPVGTYEAGSSPYGCMDMVGNVWEWCRDRWSENFLRNVQKEAVGNTDRLKNIYNSTGSTKRRVLRGGSWVSSDKSLRVTIRVGEYKANSVDNYGFRCVIVPEESGE